MMTFNVKDYAGKLACIKKYYKNDKLFLETYFDNYNNFHVYFRIDYVERLKAYRLRWFDLDLINCSKVEKYENCECIEDDAVKEISQLASSISVANISNYKGKNNNVSVFIDAKGRNCENININFYKYIPEGCTPLYEIMAILFEFLPKRLCPFFEDMSRSFEKNVSNFEYDKSFRFNLFKDNLEKIFDKDSIERGKKYYDDNSVLFLEKIDDRYFSVVNGDELYLIIVKYDEASKDVQVYCSCPCDSFCDHLYSVILAIRESKYRAFYKVMIKKEYADMYDRLMNFNYTLSIGMVEDVFGIIGDNGDIQWLDILDENKNSRWVIVEDDSKNDLEKKLTNILDNCNKYAS